MTLRQRNKDFVAWAASRRQMMQGRRGLRRKPPRWMFPDNQLRAYFWKLRAMIARARAIVKDALPGLLAAIERETADHPRLDDAADLQLKSLNEKIMDVFDDEDAKDLAARVIAGTDQFNRQQFSRVVKAVLGIDIYAAEPWLAPLMSAAVSANVDLIQSIGKQITDGIRQATTDALLGGLNTRDFTATIFSELKGKRGVFQKVETRAKLIARDQIGKFNGAATRLRQTNIGGEEYIWRTSEDERVRPTHQAHDGKTFKWSEPPADTGHPGEDYQCRCYAEMKFDFANALNLPSDPVPLYQANA